MGNEAPAGTDMMPRIFRYVVRYDSGVAPRPFDGYCSLAICKPKIRANAIVGDWIIGFRTRSPGDVILECARFSGHDSAPTSGRHLSRVMPPLEFDRSKVSESRMSSDAIVEHLDVLEYRPLCLFPGGKAS